MAWEHLSITKPHLVYIILGGFTTLFMLCSSIIKERLYIGEATVATICGLIFGPHGASLIDPESWGSTDIVTIEFSRIVLVVQCFAVGVELPKFYMERHWRSVVFLLLPVMTFGWLVTSLFVWWLVPPLSWLESLVVAACVTATDPVLASSVVGKGKFAKRVPKHLRDLLSAESGCNDGMAFPFIYLSLYLIQDKQAAGAVSFHWIVYTILYECVFGAVYGFLIGYIARHSIKFAEQRSLIDRESFLVFYFVLALFCAGSGSILGVDDLLVGFSCGVGFSNDGWFTQQTEESHVSNVIDLLLNLTYFVYLGTIIPWEQFNDVAAGLSAGKLAALAVLVILFRRIPIMLLLKPLIPDIKTWREALFAGHFGPIGVGAIFVAIMARAELESEDPIPLANLPPSDHPHYVLLSLVWPIVTFLVISSIIVHGSSVAVFTLSRHINTLTLTMSYTKANEDGPSWMNRLPRITSTSRSQARTMSDTDMDDLKLPEFPPDALPPVGVPGQFLRRVKDEDNPSRQGSRTSSVSRSRRRRKREDSEGPGGPISQSAIFPQRRSQSEHTILHGENSSQSPTERQEPDLLLSPMNALNRGRAQNREPESTQEPEQGDEQKRGRGSEDASSSRRRPSVPGVEIYEEGDHIVIENEEGDVLAVKASDNEQNTAQHAERLKKKLGAEAREAGGGMSWDAIKKKVGHWREEEAQKRKEKAKSSRKHEPARAYQFGNTIIVEDENGEVLKKYELPPQQKPEGGGGGSGGGSDFVSQGLKYMGMGHRGKAGEKSTASAGGAFGRSQAGRSQSAGGASGEPSTTQRPKKTVADEQEEEDDRHIRFTIGGVGQRMTKEGFINEMRKLDKTTRKEVVEHSDASNVVKTLAKQDQSQQQRNPEQRGGGRDASESVSGPAPSVAQGGRKATSRSPNGSPEKKPISPVGEEYSDTRAPRLQRRSPSRSPSPKTRLESQDSAPSRSAPETAVERRRRLAVLQGVGGSSGGAGNGEDGDEVCETPAERRRREAALGTSGEGGEEEEDSDDDDTPRVPSVRRGIRFAPAPERAPRH